MLNTVKISIVCCMLVLAGCQSASTTKPVYYDKDAKKAGQTLHPSYYDARGSFQRGQPDFKDPAGQLESNWAAGTAGSATNVAMLLPLSGRGQALGKSMLDGATLAVFESNASNLALKPYDTKGTSDGTVSAAREAVNEGANIILGPVFAANVRSIAPVALSANVPVIAFSNDADAAGGNVYVMGIQPEDQIKRVVEYAASQGINRFAILAPRNTFGNKAVGALRQATQRADTSVIAAEYFSPDMSDLTDAVRTIGRLASTVSLNVPFDDEDQRNTYQALILPISGNQLRAVTSLLPYFNVSTENVKILGLSSWHDPKLSTDRVLHGAWFAGSPLNTKELFAQKYQAAFSRPPKSIESLAYDATALSVLLSRSPDGFNETSLRSASGYAGIDGVFRFNRKGVAERALAVIEVGPSGFSEVSPADSFFTFAQY